MTAREQIEALLESVELRERIHSTAQLDLGSEEAAAELAQQLSFEVLRASRRYDKLNSAEAFLWACYRNCKRDALRKAERFAKRSQAEHVHG